MLTIRQSTLADLQAVDDLFRRVYPKLLKEDYAPSIRVLVLPRISRANPRLLRSGTYFVAEWDSQIVGAGGWSPDARRRGRGHIRHVVTSDLHLRRGIARAILEHAFAQATAAGIREMITWSTFTAEPFYAAMGFRKLGLVDVPLDQAISFPAVEMMRKL